MKNKTAMSEKAEAPKSRNMPKDKLSKGYGVVAGAKRPLKMYAGGSLGTKGTARGMGAAVKGGKFTDV